MKLAIYDPKPTVNNYVEKMWLEPLMQFCRNKGVAVKEISDPIPEYGWTMICNAHHLHPDLIRHFAANKCLLVAISCNDSAYLTASIDNPDLWLIPLVFTISGVQKTNVSKQSVMNPDMTVSTRDVEFLPLGQWEIYDQMRRDGRLLPLPYVPWDRLDEVPIPETKQPKILFRGGNHFWRFVAYLHALKAGVAHPASGFLCQDYFREDMVPQFRYCTQCRKEWAFGGQNLDFTSYLEMCECASGLGFEEPLKWNNRTPRAFYYLASKIVSESGGPEMEAVEVALNYRRQSAEHHLRAIADAAFFAEAKWEFSIPFPQRYFEAASVGTATLVPERANDQDYFPHMEPGRQYLTFKDDFSNIGELHSPETAAYVGQQAKGLYEHWIKPTEYVTGSRLLAYILQEIERVAE